MEYIPNITKRKSIDIDFWKWYNVVVEVTYYQSKKITILSVKA